MKQLLRCSGSHLTVFSGCMSLSFISLQSIYKGMHCGEKELWVFWHSFFISIMSFSPSVFPPASFVFSMPPLNFILPCGRGHSRSNSHYYYYYYYFKFNSCHIFQSLILKVLYFLKRLLWKKLDQKMHTMSIIPAE